MIILGFIALLAGLHMIAQPAVYVGKGPIPAQSATNVRAMGVMFAILGGTLTAFVLIPFLLS